MSATCPFHEPDQSSPCPHPTSWRSNLIFSSHLGLGPPCGLFPSFLLIKSMYALLLAQICVTFPPPHLNLPDLITLILFVEEYRSWSSSICSFTHFPLTPSHLGQNILLSTLFSKSLSLCSSPSVSDQVSHPYKTIGNIIVLCIFNFMCLYSKLEDKKCCT